jgi:hypothetical protein
MRRITWTMLAGSLVLAALFPTAGARPDEPPKIVFDDKQPAEIAGEIRAKGTYSLGSDRTLTVVSVTLHLWPTGGGRAEYEKCKWKDGVWSGAMSSLPVGKYNCHVNMVVRDARGNERTWSTKFETVSVSAAKLVARSNDDGR